MILRMRVRLLEWGGCNHLYRYVQVSTLQRYRVMAALMAFQPRQWFYFCPLNTIIVPRNRRHTANRHVRKSADKRP
jgi:hypothetical protein